MALTLRHRRADDLSYARGVNPNVPVAHIQVGLFFRDQVEILRGIDWTIESGHLTPSLKLKRNVVLKDHEKDIEALYSSPKK